MSQSVIAEYVLTMEEAMFLAAKQLAREKLPGQQVDNFNAQITSEAVGGELKFKSVTVKMLRNDPASDNRAGFPSRKEG